MGRNAMVNKLHNILLIDNEPISIKSLQSLLSKADYKLELAPNAQSGYQILEADPKKYSAIILGLNSNDSNLKLLQQINSNDELKTIAKIIRGVSADSEELELCIRSGARYYLPANISKEDLAQVIATAVRDQERYMSVEKSASTTKPLKALTEAVFKIQNLEQAQSLAVLLANECPNPNLAAVGINEILINAIEHGNLGITYNEKTQLANIDAWLKEVNRRLLLPENQHKYVTVKFSKNPTHIHIRIVDEGNGFSWDQYQSLNNKRVLHNHGRGIVMARNLSFESLIYHGSGNDVECIIPLDNAKSSNFIGVFSN